MPNTLLAAVNSSTSTIGTPGYLVLANWSGVFKSPSDYGFLLRYIPPTWVDGVPVVFKLGEKRWQNTLAGKFFGYTPSCFAIKDFVSRAWKQFGNISVSTTEDGLALFKFSDNVSCDKVLKRPWHFNRKAFMLKRWTPGCKLGDLFIDSQEL